MSEQSNNNPFFGLSMDQNPEAFYETIEMIGNKMHQDIALTILHGFSEAEVAKLGENADSETHFKIGLSYEIAGEIERDLGDYGDALLSSRKARKHIEIYSHDDTLRPASLEAWLLMHPLNDPIASIEPYETVTNIYEERFSKSLHAPAREQFDIYLDHLSHLAGAYEAAGDHKKLAHVTTKLVHLNGLPNAIFGFHECQDEQVREARTKMSIAESGAPLFLDIRDAITKPLSENDDIASERKKLTALQEITDRPEFLPGVPVAKDHIRLSLIRTSAMLSDDYWKNERDLKTALSMAVKHKLLPQQTAILRDIYVNQLQRDAQPQEVIKSMKRALLAGEKASEVKIPPDVSGHVHVVEDIMKLYLAYGKIDEAKKIATRTKAYGIKVDFGRM